MFIIIVYMNQVYDTNLKVINVMVNQVFIQKFIVHLINLTSGVVGSHSCVHSCQL